MKRVFVRCSPPMAECRYCGAKGLVLGKGKKGQTVLYELRPHIITCKARPKRDKDSPREQAVAALMGLGYKATEARAAVAGVGKPNSLEGLIVAALARIDADKKGAE